MLFQRRRLVSPTSRWHAAVTPTPLGRPRCAGHIPAVQLAWEPWKTQSTTSDGLQFAGSPVLACGDDANETCDAAMTSVARGSSRRSGALLYYAEGVEMKARTTAISKRSRGGRATNDASRC